MKSAQDLQSFSGQQLNQEDIVLFLYPPHGVTRDAWKTIQRYCNNVGFISLNPVPDAQRQVIKDQKLSLRQRVVKQLRRIKALIKVVPEVWVISGSECANIFTSYFRHFRNVRFIYAHSVEYELFFHRSQKHSGFFADIVKPYILVLDQGWYSKPKPEMLRDDQFPPAPREKFSAEIGALLKRLSADSGLPVVISNHPRADLADTQLFYPGFKVVNESSAELIRHCAFAVVNSSTSINYAVMANKPLLLVTTDELTRSIASAVEIAVSRELGYGYINMSSTPDNVDTQLLKDVIAGKKMDHYQRFKHRYIKQAQSPDLPLWESIFSAMATAQSEHPA